MPAVVLSNCTVGNSLGLSGLGTIWDSISSAVQQCPYCDGRDCLFGKRTESILEMVLAV